MNSLSLRAALLAGSVLTCGLAAAQTIVPIGPQHPLPAVTAAHAQFTRAPAVTPVSKFPVAKAIVPASSVVGTVNKPAIGPTWPVAAQPTGFTTTKPNPRIIQPLKCGPGKVESIMNGKTTCVPDPRQPRQH